MKPSSQQQNSTPPSDLTERLLDVDYGDQDLVSSIYTEDGSIDIKGNPAIKSETGRWKACRFILANECCERLAYNGIATNLVTYLTTVLHLGNAAAATSVSTWAGTCYVTPFIGAFLADAYWGRYWTIAVFSFIYFLGMILLTLSAAVPSLSPASCSSCTATTGQLSVFYTALYLIVLGTGGIKPCVSSFGADQFDNNDFNERKQMSSFFNWFYFSINIGGLLASSVLVYIQDNYSWAWGFGLPTAAMGIAVCSFVFGSPLYRHQKTGGSPLTRMLQVCVAAFRKRNHSTGKLYETEVSSIEGSRKLERTNMLTCLDKAATIDDISSPENCSSWYLCTVTQVEELKLILSMLAIWATTIVFAAVYSQISTIFVEQGSTMDRSMGPNFEIPSASLTVFDKLSVMIWIPLYDIFIIPFVQRFTGHQTGFTQIQRIGIGLIVSMMSMVAAALVEMKRLQIAKENDLLYDTDTPVPMSIFWQIPQYFLVGASEVFTFVGKMEFFYDQSPDATRSLCSALSLLSVAAGNYLSSLILVIITAITTSGGNPGWIPDNLNIGHIDYFFWLLAGLSFLNFVVFLIFAHLYKYKKVSDKATSGK